MRENFTNIEKLRRMINIESEPKVFEIEKGHVKRFAQAIGDSNPQWQEEDCTAESKYKSVIAPPTFLQHQATNDFVNTNIEPLFNWMLKGGQEVECFRPMKLHDIITTRAKIIDVYERDGKYGKLTFIVVEAIFTNQKGDIVVKSRHSFIGK